jgi:Ca2+-binding RTX toxin-like protein
MALILRGGGDDIIRAGKGRDTVFAGAGDDVVHGGAGDDALFGGLGDDTLDGGAGADLVLGGWGADTAIFNLSENGRASSGRGRDDRDVYHGGAGEDLLRLELTSDEWSRPEVQAEILAYHDFLVAGNGDEEFLFTTLHLTVSRFEALELYVDGALVDPAVQVVDLSTSTADETVIITSATGSEVTTGSGSDTVTGGDGNDTISTGAGSDFVTLGEGDDVVLAGSGDDTIAAGLAGGNDFIDGGPGIDTVCYPSLGADEPVTIDLNAFDRSDDPDVVTLLLANGRAADTPVGRANGGDWVNTDVLIDIENAIGGQGNDEITGNGDANMLDGLAGDDTLTGGAGSDTLFGGDGADLLNGGEDDDIITGGAGDDVIYGGPGTDTLVLSGNSADHDIVHLGNGRYRITDQRGLNGTDTFEDINQIVFDDFTLFDYEFPGVVERLGTPGNDELYGNDGPDAFYGGDGDDSLVGNGGPDFFVGGRGNDTFNGGNEDAAWDGVWYASDVYEGAENGIDLSFATGIVIDPFGGNDTLMGIESVYATDFDDTLAGSAGNDVFVPLGGNDTINAGGGYDILYGDAGDTAYRGIELIFSTTVEGDGEIEVDSSGDRDTFTGIESASGTEVADILLGGAGQQDIYDGDGADIIDGGADVDTLDIGGRGAVYLDMEDIASAAEVTGFVAANLGTLAPATSARLFADLSGFHYYTDGFGKVNLARGFETYVLYRGADDTLLGDGGANTFISFAGEDLLDGRAGDDHLNGGLGNDSLIGGAGRDLLLGADDNDTLVGGADADQMTGGIGADEFRFNAGDGEDTITDFEVGNDRLVLVGQTIDSVVELDGDGDGALDTRVLLSSGDTIDLLFVTGVSASDLLLST